jgi:hypothetical protein
MARDARERGAESAYMHPHTMRNVSFQGRHIVMARDARERGAESAYMHPHTMRNVSFQGRA